MSDGEHRKLDAVSHMALLKNRRQHVLDRLLRHTESERDLTIGPPCDDTSDDVALTWSQVEMLGHGLTVLRRARRPHWRTRGRTGGDESCDVVLLTEFR